MTIQFTLDKSDNIKVSMYDKKGSKFVVTLGGIEIYLTRQDLEELDEKIEEQLWDEQYHRNNLEEALENAIFEKDCLEEEIKYIKDPDDFYHY